MSAQLLLFVRFSIPMNRENGSDILSLGSVFTVHFPVKCCFVLSSTRSLYVTPIISSDHPVLSAENIHTASMSAQLLLFVRFYILKNRENGSDILSLGKYF